MVAPEEPQTVAVGGFRPARLVLTALLVGAVALVAVGLALVAVEVRDVASYPALVREISLTRLSLGPLVVVAGIAVAAAAGFLVGSLAVSASFAVAGPLYRLARNAEAQRDDPGAPVVSLRRGDLLQEDARLLAEAAAAIEAHHREVAPLADRARLAAREGDARGLDEVLARLRESSARVRLDG